jgi:predicted PurR-regulated permease PerM
VDQFNLLIDDLPHITETVKEKAQKLVENENFASLFTGKIQEQFTTYAQKAFPVVKDNILGAISAVTGIASVLLTVPFMVFYLLKDDRIFYRRLSNVIHRKYRREITDIIKETDKTRRHMLLDRQLLL